MLSKYKNFIRIFFLGLIVVSVVYFSMQNKTKEPQKVEIIQPKNEEIIKEYPFRKYLHVKKFYTNLAKSAVDIGLKYNIPPGALLAIAGVESGYGNGYVARITGNILSLGAQKGDKELPALYLPNIKNFPSKVLYSPEKIKKYKKSELVWKKRPRSHKKDYRPAKIAGTSNELDYFDKHPKEKLEANVRCMEEFARDWIDKDKTHKPFVEAREMLDREVKLHSQEILFDEELNKKFIKMIGGRKNSFNYRKTWPKKVITVMDKTGLVELTKGIYKTKKSSDELW